MSATVLVTVVGPGGRGADLVVPAGVPVAGLLDGLRAALPGPQPAAVTLAPLGGDPLPPGSSLTACGIGDGAVLALLDGAAGRPGDPPPPGAPLPGGPAPSWRTPPRGGPAPSSRTPLHRRDGPLADALPVPWPPATRVSLALGALLRPAGPGAARPRRALARARLAWRDSSYERRLRAAVAAAPLARCARVAVVGATPRAGATTVAALLAAVLADGRPGRTVAVDASPGPGSLTELLAPGHGLFADELLGLLDHPMLTRRELRAVLAGRGPLAVLAARPAATPLDGRAWARAVDALARHATTVVVDCGPGVASPGARAATAAAEQFVLVTDPRLPQAAVTAALLLAELGRPALLLVNRVAELRAGEVVERVPGARGAVLLPADPAAAALLAARPAAAADWAWLPARWRRPAGELAALLAAEWPSLGTEGC